jgi:hypothetical protein
VALVGRGDRGDARETTAVARQGGRLHISDEGERVKGGGGRKKKETASAASCVRRVDTWFRRGR